MAQHPTRWPGYMPYPTGPIKRWGGQVPNASSVNWPQSQFAPLYLPPGSASFQRYRYVKGGSLDKFQPSYSTENVLHSGRGPGGDTSAVPASYGGYGDCGCARNNPAGASCATRVGVALLVGAIAWNVWGS